MSSTEFADNVDRLGEIAGELEACESVEELYRCAVDAADQVLTFDSAVICIDADGQLVPAAVSSDKLIPGEPRSVDTGIAGRTLETGQTQVIEDCQRNETVSPSNEAIRSVLSIPIETDGVLQFHAHAPRAFSTLDRELGELLAASIVNARAYVSYETALSKERDQFAALFENLSDAAAQYHEDDDCMRIEAVNASFVSTFGVDAEAAIGDPLESVLAVPDESAVEDPGPPISETSESEVEVVRETTAGPRPFLRRTVPITSSRESNRGYRLYTDLTELKVRERELERQNERLERFASIVSHDLRNPLTVANGYLELVRDELGPDHEAVEQIEQSHGRMEELIDDVLTVAREEREIDELEPVRLGALAEEAWEHVDTAGGTLEIRGGDVWIDAEPTRLSQLFENLFRNAVEHGSTSHSGVNSPEDAVEHGSTSHSGGDGPTVRVTSTGTGFLVEDDGPGIPPDRRVAVFESGYSTAGESTGLGLAIVEQIVAEHGWSISITDGDLGGACFEIDGVYPTTTAETASITTGTDANEVVDDRHDGT